MHTISADSAGTDEPHDPFSTEGIAENPLLYVSRIGTEHHLLLNKFNTFPDHVSVLPWKTSITFDIPRCINCHFLALYHCRLC